MGYFQELYNLGSRPKKPRAKLSVHKERLPKGVKVGWCPKCQCWYNLEELGQRYCAIHGRFLDDIHVSVTRYRERLPYP